MAIDDTSIDEEYIGSSFDDFLKEEEILQEVTAGSIKRVLAFQIKQEMKNKGLSKSAMSKKNEYKQAVVRSSAKS